MEFNQLEIFLAIVKYKSFSKAADQLYLTQPTVSLNIQNLERELETTLINRSGRKISLTPSGELFLQLAKEIIHQRDRAKFIIKEHAGRIQGTLELLCSSIPEQYVLPYIIRDFRLENPDVSFVVTQKNSMEILNDILAGRENFGIVGIEAKSRALETIPFYEDDLVLALPYRKDYPESFSQLLEMEDLLHADFLFRKEDSGTRVFIEKSLEKINIDFRELNIVSILDSNEMIKKMVELGQGISFLPRISIKNEVDLGLIKAFYVKDMHLKRSFYFAYSKYRTLPPHVEAFKNFIKNWPGI